MNLQVSIIIVFYDNDWTLIPTLLKHIRERIKITHEVILIDNREKFKDKKIELETNEKIYPTGYNAYQFEGRRFSAQFIKGDYAWFIDADDDVCEINSINFKEGFDIILFSYESKFFKDGGAFNDRKYILQKDYLYSYWITFQQDFGALWNKWIKSSIVKKSVEKIPVGKKIIAGEDGLYIRLFFNNSKTLLASSQKIYIYNGPSHNFSFNSILKITCGVSDAYKINKELISQDSADIHIYNDILYMINGAELNKTYKNIKTLYLILYKIYKSYLNKSILSLLVYGFDIRNKDRELRECDIGRDSFVWFCLENGVNIK